MIDMDFQIMLQIVTGGNSSHLPKMALLDLKQTLNKLLLKGRHAEMSSFQTAEIDKNTDSVLVVNRTPNQN